jgi:hypothetical protein
MAAKFSLKKYFIASIDVRIPTKAIIPKEMIRIVSIDRSM